MTSDRHQRIRALLIDAGCDALDADDHARQLTADDPEQEPDDMTDHDDVDSLSISERGRRMFEPQPTPRTIGVDSDAEFFAALGTTPPEDLDTIARRIFGDR